MAEFEYSAGMTHACVCNMYMPVSSSSAEWTRSDQISQFSAYIPS